MHVYICNNNLLLLCIPKEERIGLGDYFRIEIRCMEDVHKNTNRDHLSNCLRRKTFVKVFLNIKTFLIIFHIDKENLMSKPESESNVKKFHDRSFEENNVLAFYDSVLNDIFIVTF